MANFESKDKTVRQMALVTFFLDKFVIRAGNAKDEDEEAETSDCSSMRLEDIALFEEKDGKNT